MTWSADEPYDELPLLPPQTELETHRVLKATILAREALARLDARASALPNPAVLINAIPLLEAQASNQIENIVTTTDELFEAAAYDGDASPAAREALRYRTALRVGFDELRRGRPLTAHTAAELCSTIRGHEVVFRRDEVFIGEPVQRRRVYTPPARPDVLDVLLSNWSSFVNEPSELDPLVRMAVAHYQFEAIHPFHDGNGRTGRIINVLMLCAAGRLRLPVLYLSRFIIANKDEYYRRLAAVTSAGAWEDWIVYMVEGVRSTAHQTLDLVDQIEEVRGVVATAVRSVLHSADGDLVAVLMEQPYCRIRDVVARCEVTRQTAGRWLHGLEQTGVLAELRVGREMLFINEALMDVLRR